MQSVGAHQGKEGREKGTPGRPRAYAKHVTELPRFEAQKRYTQDEGDRHPKIVIVDADEFAEAVSRPAIARCGQFPVSTRFATVATDSFSALETAADNWRSAM